MKEGWKVKPLGEVCTLEKLQGIHSSLPYVGLEDIESHTAKFIGSLEPKTVKSSTFRFTSDHVLYGRLRPYLNKVIAPNFEGHCSTEIFPIKPSHDVLREYLLYWILCDQTCERINATCTGARMPRAQMSEVLELEFLLPPLPDQHRIVAILDEAFDGIATAKANAEKNLQNARALFESHLQSVFTQRGEGWVARKMGEIYDVRDGTHDSPKFHESGYPLVTSKNLKRNGLDFSSVKYISEEDYKKINQRSAVDIGDILFAMIGTIGNPVLIEKEPKYAIKNMALFKVSGTQSSEFLRYYLGSESTLSKMKREANGTTQKFVGLGYLRNFEIHLPDLEIQKRVVAELDDLRAETQRLESLYQKKIAALDALKQSLLHQAFRGQL